MRRSTFATGERRKSESAGNIRFTADENDEELAEEYGEDPMSLLTRMLVSTHGVYLLGSPPPLPPKLVTVFWYESLTTNPLLLQHSLLF